ncbi:MAG: helix-turn-helix transcriptional regulator [Verrucomicrobia bacterium]|nr:helix-turn-helix transcriptional regulator [Verrucomicrobiota bacterium]MBI3870564.1 helix-turn-helix transcriptional regulator [Verrucomicrobiota bacterium]
MPDSKNSDASSPLAGSSWEGERLWGRVGAGWRQLFGSFEELGVSFEWHDFQAGEPVDWSRSFHPHSLELCLNLEGVGVVRDRATEARFLPGTAGYYWTGAKGADAWREGGQRHRFISVEFSREFLRRHLGASCEGLHPIARLALDGADGDRQFGVSGVTRMTSGQTGLVRTLQHPPVLIAAQQPWYIAKALELAAAFLYEPPAETDLFCRRQQHVAAERVDKVIALLRAHLAEPLSLTEVARRVGCSQFYLSRTFTQATGMTISQYLRQLRMERAAELLRSGKFNVTEAALEVGYNSLSHFSHTFRLTFGCCPGLYPVAKV